MIYFLTGMWDDSIEITNREHCASLSPLSFFLVFPAVRPQRSQSLCIWIKLLCWHQVFSLSLRAISLSDSNWFISFRENIFIFYPIILIKTWDQMKWFNSLLIWLWSLTITTRDMWPYTTTMYRRTVTQYLPSNAQCFYSFFF